MLHKEQSVQECDATEDAQRWKAGYIKFPQTVNEAL